MHLNGGQHQNQKIKCAPQPDQKINLRKYDKQNYTQLTKLFTKKSIMNEDEIFIRNLAFEYLSKIGLKQNKKYLFIKEQICIKTVVPY